MLRCSFALPKGEKSFIITPDEATAVKVQECLSELQDGVLLYPTREMTFVEVAGVSRDFEHIRLGVLSRILQGDYSAVVMSAAAACQYTMPPEELEKRTFKISVNDEINIAELEKSLFLQDIPVMTRLTEQANLLCVAEL